jgi:hypothetical protein
MPGWPKQLFTRRPAVDPVDPDAEAAVAAELLPRAREILLALGAPRGRDAMPLLERARPQRVEVLAPPETEVALLERLLDRGYAVYEAALALDRDILVLDRRVGWRLTPWEPLPNAFLLTHRLLWTRLGYYTVHCGVVDTVHPAERLFTCAGSQLWVNAAYRDLSLPQCGERVRVVGLISYIGTTLPVLHALRIAALPDE